MGAKVFRGRWVAAMVLAAPLVVAGGCAEEPAPSDTPAERIAPPVVEPAAPKVAGATRRVHVFVSGRVQGVGFRDFTATRARRLGVTGFVRNLADGRVEAVIEGPAGAVQELVDQMKQGPSAARVERVETSGEPPQGQFQRFDITF